MSPCSITTSQAEILKAENKAFGVKEEAEKPAQKTHDAAPKNKEQEETGIIASVKRFRSQAHPQETFRTGNHNQRREPRNPHWHHEVQSPRGLHHGTQQR